MVTRLELIKAAREVFARVGFEAARLEDIAAKAGKTRGAFYDHFNDKEDVFFAIFEEDIAGDHEKIAKALARAKNIDARVDIMSDHLTDLLRQRQRLMLNLAFKAYVIRRPQKRKRLSALYADMTLRCAMAKINTLFPELVDLSPDVRRRLTMEFGAVMDGLALNALFNPEGLNAEQRKRYIQLATEEVLREARKLERAESTISHRNKERSIPAAMAL